MVRLREHLSVTAYGLGSDIHVTRDVSRDVTREFLSPGSLMRPLYNTSKSGARWAQNYLQYVMNNMQKTIFIIYHSFREHPCNVIHFFLNRKKKNNKNPTFAVKPGDWYVSCGLT